ncbi:MAG: DNA-binding response regulator [Nitrospirae bacterium GWD2_57_9]|nr:MAG: DNA-binding response regulator [Nitrospirae bacterium GWD2_57_9]
MVQPVLIIEDDKKIARVIKVYLEEAGFKAVHAATGKDGLALALKEPPLLVILDLMLPDVTGEELYQDLKNQGDFPVIMVTAKSSVEERVAGFALGADDYMVKPFSPRELAYRVKAVLKRSQGNGEPSAAMSFNAGLLTIDGQTFQAAKKGKVLNLTATEFKLLSVLAAAPARVFTREELVEKALGYRFEGYERSVDAHIKNLRQKLEDDPKNPALIQTVYGVGYRFSGRRDA